MPPNIGKNSGYVKYNMPIYCQGIFAQHGPWLPCRGFLNLPSTSVDDAIGEVTRTQVGPDVANVGGISHQRCSWIVHGREQYQRHADFLGHDAKCFRKIGIIGEHRSLVELTHEGITDKVNAQIHIRPFSSVFQTFTT